MITMAGKRRFMKDAISEEEMLADLLDRFNRIYDDLYTKHSMGQGYDDAYESAIDGGDRMIHEHHPIIEKFCDFRQDLIMSDREVASFYLAWKEFPYKSAFSKSRKAVKSIRKSVKIIIDGDEDDVHDIDDIYDIIYDQLHDTVEFDEYLEEMINDAYGVIEFGNWSFEPADIIKELTGDWRFIEGDEIDSLCEDAKYELERGDDYTLPNGTTLSVLEEEDDEDE